MPLLQREREQDQVQDQDESRSGSWLGLLLGIGTMAVAAGTAVWTWHSERRYTAERHAHLAQCPKEFVAAEELLNSGHLQAGDMLEFKRTHYQHWALYIADGIVIHVNNQGKIVLADLLEVGRNCVCRVNLLEENATARNLQQVGSREDIVMRAMGMVEKQVDYHLCDRNCEHFVTECFYGSPFSVQQEILNRNVTVKTIGIFGSSTLPHD